MIAFNTLLLRELKRFMRVWQQSLIPPIVTSSLFIVIFGYSLGSRISNIGGVSYLEYIFPGLLMMGVIMSSYMNCSFSIFQSKFQGNIQEILVSPMSYWQIITAVMIGGIIRSMLVGLGISLVAIFFAKISILNYPLLILYILFTSIIFSLAGIITGVWATGFDRVNVFSTFILTPLTYLGGVFYSVSMLPPFWQKIAQFNPLLYMIDGFRYSFIGSSEVPIISSLIVIIIVAISLFYACLWIFKSGYKLRT